MKTRNLFLKFMTATMIAAASMMSFSSCGGDDDDDNGGKTEKKTVSMRGVTASSNTRNVSLGSNAVTENVAASISGTVSKDVTVTFDVDNSLISAYNTANSTSYVEMPSAAITFATKIATIATNKLASNELPIVFGASGLTDGTVYLVPVVIKSVSPTDVAEVSSTLKELYLLVTYTESTDPDPSGDNFSSLDMSDYNLYSNYVFEEPITVTNYTFEFKFYANELERGKKFRIGDPCDANEGYINMIRFAEPDGQGQFEWYHGSTNRVKAYTNSEFMPGEWYLVSMVFDGTNLQFYVDGVASGDPVAAGTTSEFAFQRMEIGSSWQNSREGNVFSGRIAELRFWDKALSASEIAAGKCGVSNTASGLRAYWKLNDGEGHVFTDSTGNGHDMDWSKTQRDGGSNSLTDFDYSQYVNWITDEYNVCQ